MRSLIYQLILIPFFLLGISFAAFGQCDNDNVAPLAVCNDQINAVLDENGTVKITPELLDAGSNDACTNTENLIFRIESGVTQSEEIPTATSVQFDAPDQYVVTLWVMDEAGNSNLCWSEVKVTDKQECDEDTEAPTLTCLKNLYTIDLPLLVFAEDFIDTVTDNCAAKETISFSIQLAADFIGSLPTTRFLEVNEPGIYKVYVWASDLQGNSDFCTSELIVKESIQVKGAIYQDEDKNCLKSANETGTTQSVRITLFEDNVATYTTVASSNNGNYQERIPKPSTTNARVEATLEITNFSTCTELVTADIQGNNEEVTLSNIGLQLQQGCADLGVMVEALSTGCEQEGVYIIKFYNGGTEAAKPIITVDFSNKIFTAQLFSTHPFEFVVNPEHPDLYTFEVENLQSGANGDIIIVGQQSCDFDNQTQVVTATIAADNACSNNYTGPEINITKDCVGDEVQFRIHNIGQEDMLVPAEFIVIEDVIMREKGTFELGAGESKALNLIAAGSTIHLQADQVAAYPWQSNITAVSEGCATDASTIKTGFVAQLPLENSAPFIDVDIIENKAIAFNRIAALPIGVGEKKLVNPNTPIEYAIHFANDSKNAVAKNLTIETTISESLDLNTLQVTFTSPPEYVLTKNENNTVTFAFPNISLLSSEISADEGTGLIKFTIAQKADLQEKTLIENTIKLSFDNRTPISNSIFHTVGNNAISTSTTDRIKNTIGLRVYPNPFTKSTHFQVDNPNSALLHFELYNANGQLVRQRPFNTQAFTLHQNNLKNGFYFYVIKEMGQPVVVGKLFME